MRRLVLLIAALLAVGAALWAVPAGDPAPPEPRATGASEPDAARAERRRVSAPPDSDRDPENEPSGEATDGADAGADPELEVRVLRVVDENGSRLAGVPARCPTYGTRATNDAGEVGWSWVPGSPMTVTLPAFDRRVDLAGPLTVETVAGARPVDVRCVDLETGRPLEVTWIGDDEPTLVRRATWAQPRGEIVVPVDVFPPNGWTLGPGGRRHYAGIADARAREHLVIIPVAREARVRVTVVRHDGTPAVGARVSVESTMWPRNAEARAGTGAGGTAIVREVRFVRGERLRLRAIFQETEQSFGLGFVAESEPIAMTDPEAWIDVALRLPAEPTDLSALDGDDDGLIGIGGSGGGAASDVLPSASLRVVARLADGAPAAHVRVAVQEANVPCAERDTDAEGVAVFPQLSAATYDVWLVESGVVPTCVTVAVADGQDAAVEITEAPGRTLDVFVADARGRPLPCARVFATLPASLPLWPYAHTDSGVQTLPLLTDESGRARLVGLPAELRFVGAQYGSRLERVEVGTATDPVRITVPDAGQE